MISTVHDLCVLLVGCIIGAFSAFALAGLGIYIDNIKGSSLSGEELERNKRREQR